MLTVQKNKKYEIDRSGGVSATCGSQKVKVKFGHSLDLGLSLSRAKNLSTAVDSRGFYIDKLRRSRLLTDLFCFGLQAESDALECRDFMFA